MIRVTLALCPGGLEGEGIEEHLGTIYIANQVGETLRTGGARGTYKYKLLKKRRGRVCVEGVIPRYPRNAYHPWELVRRILNDAAGQGRL